MPNTSKLLFKSIGFYANTMSAHDSHLGWRLWSSDSILKVYYPRTIHAMFALIWLVSEEKTFKQFSHRSYVKTISVDGGHFGPRSGSLNTILAVRGPSNEHFWQVWFNSVQWFHRRRFKYEKLTTDDGRLPMTKAHMAYGQVS